MSQRIEARAGDYNKRVRIMQDDPSENPDGQKVEDPTLLCRRWAKVVPFGGGERFQDGQTQADVTHRVRMHSDSHTRQITPKMWLLLSDGTRLNIERVLDVEGRRTELELLCNERI